MTELWAIAMRNLLACSLGTELETLKTLCTVSCFISLSAIFWNLLTHVINVQIKSKITLFTFLDPWYLRAIVNPISLIINVPELCTILNNYRDTFKVLIQLVVFFALNTIISHICLITSGREYLATIKAIKIVYQLTISTDSFGSLSRALNPITIYVNVTVVLTIRNHSLRYLLTKLFFIEIPSFITTRAFPFVIKTLTVRVNIFDECLLW